MAVPPAQAPTPMQIDKVGAHSSASVARLTACIAQELVMSAFGKKVRKGELDATRSPEVRLEEIECREKIGGGCFGQVFKGRCRGYDVAIKVPAAQVDCLF